MKRLLLGLLTSLLMACGGGQIILPPSTNTTSTTEMPKQPITGFTRDAWHLDIDNNQWQVLRLEPETLLLVSTDQKTSLAVMQKKFEAPLPAFAAMEHQGLLAHKLDVSPLTTIAVNQITAMQMRVVYGKTYVVVDMFATGHHAIMLGCGGLLIDESFNTPRCQDVLNHLHLTE